MKKFLEKAWFWITFFRVVRFWIEFFIARQILKPPFKHTSDFDLNIIQHVRFCVYYFCRLPNFHVFIKTVRFANVCTYGEKEDLKSMILN